jgi:RNA polymerase sigma factor (sigma-70 family)
MENGEQRSDTELLLAPCTCSEPFGVFYERHFASVLAFFRRRVSGPEEAFDLAAETFAAALASVPRFQPGPEPPQAWLFAIARHKLSEALRRHCRFPLNQRRPRHDQRCERPHAMSQWLVMPMAKEVATLIERAEEQIRDPSVQEFGQVVRVGTAVDYGRGVDHARVEIHGTASAGDSSTTSTKKPL